MNHIPYYQWERYFLHGETGILKLLNRSFYAHFHLSHLCINGFVRNLHMRKWYCYYTGLHMSDITLRLGIKHDLPEVIFFFHTFWTKFTLKHAVIAKVSRPTIYKIVQSKFFSGHFACAAAALIGNQPLLKYLRHIGCTWTVFAGAYAATAGYFQILQWCVENGCPISNTTFCFACSGGHINIINYLHELRCEVIHRRAFEWAARSPQPLVIMKWLFMHGYTLNNVNIQGLIRQRCFNTSVLQWMVDHGCLYNPRNCLKILNRLTQQYGNTKRLSALYDLFIQELLP